MAYDLFKEIDNLKLDANLKKIVEVTAAATFLLPDGEPINPKTASAALRNIPDIECSAKDFRTWFKEHFPQLLSFSALEDLDKEISESGIPQETEKQISSSISMATKLGILMGVQSYANNTSTSAAYKLGRLTRNIVDRLCSK